MARPSSGHGGRAPDPAPGSDPALPARPPDRGGPRPGSTPNDSTAVSAAGPVRPCPAAPQGSNERSPSRPSPSPPIPDPDAPAEHRHHAEDATESAASPARGLGH